MNNANIRIAAVLTLIATAVLTTAAFVAPATRDVALRHTSLVKSEPMKDSTVTAPRSITLYFNEAVKASVAGVRLLASDSSVIALGALKNGEGSPAPVVAPVTSTLKAGQYRVMWRVAGDDGHPVSGSFVFAVKNATPNP